MRIVYADEAGVSSQEPISVVVALVVNADTQWVPAAKAVAELQGRAVPEEFRSPRFISHAKEVFSSDKYRKSNWTEDDRTKYLCDLIAITRRLGIPVAWTTTRRSTPVPVIDRLSPAQVQHARVFGYCMAMADRVIRDYGAPEEIGFIVAEDVQSLRQNLREVVQEMIHRGVAISTDRIKAHSVDGISIPVAQLGPLKFWIERLVDGVHFAQKDEAPLLQLADACAWGLRRYISKQRRGLEFAIALAGSETVAAEFTRDISHPTAGGMLNPESKSFP